MHVQAIIMSAIPIAVADTTFVTGQTFGGQTDRNNLTGGVGFKITVGGASITVTQLGRWIQSQNSQTHTLRIRNTSSTDLGNVTVAANGAPADAFLYGALGTPVVLSASTSYYILSDESNGGDWWVDQAGTTVSHTAAATVPNAAYYLGSVQDAGGTDSCYVTVSFKYHL